MRTSEECVVTEVGSRGCFQKGVTADRVNLSRGVGLRHSTDLRVMRSLVRTTSRLGATARLWWAMKILSVDSSEGRWFWEEDTGERG